MSSQKEIQKPYIYENKESNTMIIFIHGILEGPKQFKKFIDVVYKEGFSYYAVLLDGHGKSGKDFARSNKEKWIDTVEKAILKYKDNYENIILVGHSMGSLLSVLIASKYKNKIKGLVLISTPFKIFVKFNIIVSSIRIILGKVREEDILAMQIEEAFSVERCSPLTHIGWIPRYLDLFTLIRLSRKELKNIEVPTLIVHCKKDELVSHKSLKVFENELQNNYKVINLEKSGHFRYDDSEIKDLLNEFKIFINEL